MPRFLMVVHIVVSSGCWHRLLEAKVALGQADARDDLVLDAVGDEEDHLLRRISRHIAAKAGGRHDAVDAGERAGDICAVVGSCSDVETTQFW